MQHTIMQGPDKQLQLRDHVTTTAMFDDNWNENALCLMTSFCGHATKNARKLLHC